VAAELGQRRSAPWHELHQAEVPTSDDLRKASASLRRSAETSAAHVAATYQLIAAFSALLENAEAAIFRHRQATIETALVARLVEARETR
jgi:hypothetical protein